MLYYQQRILRKNGACLCSVRENFGRGGRSFFLGYINALQERQPKSQVRVQHLTPRFNGSGGYILAIGFLHCLLLAWV